MCFVDIAATHNRFSLRLSLTELSQWSVWFRNVIVFRCEIGAIRARSIDLTLIGRIKQQRGKFTIFCRFFFRLAGKCICLLHNCLLRSCKLLTRRQRRLQRAFSLHLSLKKTFLRRARCRWANSQNLREVHDCRAAEKLPLWTQIYHQRKLVGRQTSNRHSSHCAEIRYTRHR